MKILVTGVGGQLGYDVLKCLKKRKIDCIGADKEDFDITDVNAVQNFISKVKPDAVIHCSAFTAVDQAEEKKELCYDVNVNGVRYIADVCKKLDCKMMYISTDYVFEGTGKKFYEVDNPKKPMSQYGITKFMGEQEVIKRLNKYFIVRISWVFGKNGNNFIKTMLRLGMEKEQISVVSDQFGSPTYTADLAPLLCDMIETEKYGIYHATNEGVCSWAELAQKIFTLKNMNVEVKKITSEEFAAKAVRPKNSRLSKKSLTDAGFYLLPNWEDALKRYLNEII